MPDPKKDLDEALKQRFAQLPKVVQAAMLSSDIEAHLRALSNVHKLHLDQWEALENEVMLTLLGIQKIERLQENIEKEVGVPREVSKSLADDISQRVFEPIRRELEQQLEHPTARPTEQTGVEAAREHLIGASTQPSTALVVNAAPAMPPPTPPPAPPNTTVIRAPSSGAYKVGEPSTERKSVVDDPYREPPK